MQRGSTVALVAREYQADLVVRRIDRVADDVVALEVGEAGGHPLPQWEPGAHVDLVLPGIGARSYSLCGDPTDRLVWRLGVLREPTSRGGSIHVHDRLAVGDMLRMRGPRNHFPLVDAQQYLFVAGGIGITPILPMLARLTHAAADWRLLYGGRNAASMAFRDELAEYGDRVVLHPQDRDGLLPLAKWLSVPHPDTVVYCCGPGGLLDAVTQTCQHWPTRTLHTERFAPTRAEPASAREFQVELARTGHTLTVPPGSSVLEVLEEAGITVDSSCRAGMCGTCETPVLTGEPEHHDDVLTPEEREANETMMVCVSRCRSRRLVLDL